MFNVTFIMIIRQSFCHHTYQQTAGQPVQNMFYIFTWPFGNQIPNSTIVINNNLVVDRHSATVINILLRGH